MNSIAVRPYQQGDFSRLIELYKDKSCYGGNFDPERDTKERLQKVSDEGNLYVAVSELGLVGSFMILDNSHSFWLLRFAIRPSSELEEIFVADKLLDIADGIAHQRGHESMIVYTDADNEKLLSRYSQLGFNKGDLYKCFWKGVSHEI